MPKRTQRGPSAPDGAQRSAGYLDVEVRGACDAAANTQANMRVDDDGTAGGSSRAQRRKMARDTSNPIGRRPNRRGGGNVNSNGLARPANAPRRDGDLRSRIGGSGGASADVSSSTNVVQTLRSFLQGRWDANARLLNLEVRVHCAARTDCAAHGGRRGAERRQHSAARGERRAQGPRHGAVEADWRDVSDGACARGVG